LGIGDWGFGPIPQTPTPQNTNQKTKFLKKKKFFYIKIIFFKFFKNIN